MALTILWLATAATVLLVRGQQFPYQLAIHFYQYSNPNHTLIDGSCCDNATCAMDCENALSLCISDGEADHADLNCSFLGLTLPVRFGGDDVNFTCSVGDMENPFVQQLSSLPASGYQVVIEFLNIESFITNGGVIYSRVGFTYVNIPASALGQPSSPQTYPGDCHQCVTVNLSYSLKCSTNYTLCTVNTVPQCLHEYSCMSGDTSTTAIVATSTTDICAKSSTAMTMDIIPSSDIPTAMDITPSSDIPTAAAGVSVGAIAGGVLAALVLVAVIAVVVVIIAAVSRHKRKKESGPPTTTPSNMDTRGENGDRQHGNMYVTVDLDHGAERTATDVANSEHQTDTLPAISEHVYTDIHRERPYLGGNNTFIELANSEHQASTIPAINEPMYTDAHGERPNLDGNRILIELANPMYDATIPQQHEEPAYQETQKEVQNILYGDQIDACIDS